MNKAPTRPGAKLLLATALLSLLMSSEFISPPEAKAKAYFASRMEMCARADLIALVDLGPVSASKYKGKTWTYSQQAQAKIEKIIQGSAPATITICGGEDFICARTTLTSGKAIAFLRKDGEVYSGSNWTDSFRPVIGGQVDWLNSPQSRLKEASATKLDQVEKDIKEDIAAAPVLQNLAEPYKTLYQALRFADQIKGEVISVPEYEAYEKVLKNSTANQKELKLLSKYAGSAGRLYAASAIYVLSHGKDKSALERLANSQAEVFYCSGCEGIKCQEGKVASALLKDGKYMNFSIK